MIFDDPLRVPDWTMGTIPRSAKNAYERPKSLEEVKFIHDFG